MANEKDDKKAAQGCFDNIGLDPELYRIGHTKARYFGPLFCEFLQNLSIIFSHYTLAHFEIQLY